MKKSYIFALLTVLVWSTSATLVKLLISNIPSLEALSISGLFAFAYLLISNIITGKIKLLKTLKVKDYLAIIALGLVGVFLYEVLYYYGITVLTSQEACILNYLWPLMVVVFSCIILKEKFTVRKIIAVVLSLGGVIILSLGNGAISQENKLLGVISCILAAVCYGLFSVVNKKLNYDQNIVMMFVWLTVGVGGIVVGLLSEEWVMIEGVQWLGLLWLGVIVDGIAYLLWAIAINSAKNTAVIANLAYLVPFLSVVLSAIVLDEKITVNAVIALFLIIGGILLQSINLKKTKVDQ